LAQECARAQGRLPFRGAAMVSPQLVQLVVVPLCLCLGLLAAVGVSMLVNPAKAQGFVSALRAARLQLQGQVTGVSNAPSSKKDE